LYKQGYVVSVLNPAVLVDYRKSVNIRSKTDALDARLLARYAHEQHPHAWKPLPQEMQTLRYLLARREDVQHMLQQERNRLHAGRMDAWIRTRVQQHIKQLDKELQIIWKRIKDHLKAHPSLKRQWRRLQTIRGIGPMSAAAILAEVGEIDRFDDPRALVSLAGLAVKRHDSGRSVHGTPKIDRHGRMGLRRILSLCAVSAIRWILLLTVCQLVTWTTMTADTTASAAASLPNRVETISQDTPAASALLIANRSNGDLDDHTLLNW
jgi:transposase